MNQTDSDSMTGRIESARQRKLDSLADPVNELSGEGVRRYSALYRQAWDRKSRAAAMKAFCLECVGYRRAEVARCTSCACPLWEWRAFRADDERGHPEIVDRAEASEKAR